MMPHGADRRDLTREDKRNLLERLLRERAGQGSLRDRVASNTSGGTAPLSFSQRRLWLFDQLEPNSSAYNISFGLRITGPLDRDALQRSLLLLATRHESLRTRFAMNDGEPLQVVSAEAVWPLEYVKLTSTRELSRDEVARVLMSETDKPFDLSKGPLARATLFEIADDVCLLVLVLHHIVCDGWSVGILLRELSEFYKSCVSGRRAELAPLPITYREFATRQRAQITTQEMNPSLDYWRKKLAGPLPITEFPTDRRRPPVQTYRPGTVGCRLDPEVERGLKGLGAAHGATLFMTALAGFTVLVARHGGNDDVILGAPVSGRLRADVEGLVGVFINTLPLRTDLSGNPSFRNALERVRDMVVEAFAHQELPFEALVEAIRPQRSLNRTPLFQILFNKLPPVRDFQLNWPGLRVEPIDEPSTPAHFDLTVYLREDRPSSSLLFVYNADLFEHDRMEDLLEQYVSLLAQVVKDPDASARRHSLSTARLRRVAPDPSVPLRSDRGGDLVRAVEAIAQRCWELPAVKDAEGVLTYADLVRTSDSLAARLRASGLKPGGVVAVYAHRNKSLVTALLGIMKAGGAFAILDPAYPAQRLVAGIEAARPAAWLQFDTAGDVPAALANVVRGIMARLTLSSDATIGCEGAERGVASEPIPSHPDLPAYVAFTSGTTGGIKCVFGTQRPVLHFLEWYRGAFHLDANDRFCLLSGLSHDPLLRDVFAPLIVGALLTIPQRDQLLDPDLLYQWFVRERITVAHMTPALAAVLTENAPAGSLPDLRVVCFGGDVLTRDTIDRMRRAAPGTICVNFYGATETPQAMGYHQVPAADSEEWARAKDVVPVGKGIDDVQLLVLNDAGDLVGIGELGEIYVRTPYLTLGYVGDGASTASRFLQNPYTRDARDRVYRTGDLGRYVSDGTLEFSGRGDSQVKIRGFRVELGEIEAVLERHPQLRQVVVTARPDVSGAHGLVGYAVAKTASVPSTGELQAFVGQTLPDYMVPSRVIFLDALPLTPNGKVDRRALPAPDVMVGQANAYVPPQTPWQEAVAEIWSEVLRVERIGVHDNFFNLGGHSLLVAQVLARIQKRLGVRIAVSQMFASPTIAGLALAVNDGRPSDGALSSEVEREEFAL